MAKKQKQDGTKSLGSIPIWIKNAENLLLNASCWHGRVRINCSINSPYLMNFMLDLTKDEAISFIEKINLAIGDIKEND